MVYREYLADLLPEKMPILEDLYEENKCQPEAEAARIAASPGAVCNRQPQHLQSPRTNVDIQNRLVCFDIKELGKQIKKPGMLIIQDQVWGRGTRYYIDEFHFLLKEE